jgi:hypothetical protein
LGFSTSALASGGGTPYGVAWAKAAAGAKRAIEGTANLARGLQGNRRFIAIARA